MTYVCCKIAQQPQQMVLVFDMTSLSDTHLLHQMALLIDDVVRVEIH